MFTFLLTLMMIDGVLLSIVVLLQAGQGGGLASLGGGTATQVLGGRAATTILTKATWWTGGLFMFFALILSLMSGRTAVGSSEVGKALQQTQAPTSATPLVEPGAAPPIGTTQAPANGGGILPDSGK
jgi:preprotein translocase subunit SecG